VNSTDQNTEYTNNVVGGNYNQNYFLNTRGYNGKMAFNVATQYDEKISLGFNVNAHFLDYERVTQFDESNTNINSIVNTVGFDNTLRTTGTGISFQLGSIIKVTEAFRVGLTYNSPTWFRISEETSQFLQTSGLSISEVLNPNVINIYPIYRLRTPSKVMGSLAYVFGDKGLLSFDYSRKDFSNMQFRPGSDPFFQFQNGVMSDILGVANTYRFGGEYRLDQLSFRGGYRIEESPYNNDTFEGDLTAFSLGLGYNFGGFALDLAFSQAQRETSYLLFSNAPTFNDAARLNQTFTDIVLTLSFGL
jgi:long-subunit fatty acid transport protein